MLPDITENASSTASLHNAYRIDDNLPVHQAEVLPLVSRMVTADQSDETLASIIASTCESESSTPDKQSKTTHSKQLFLRIFAGFTIVIAVGALSATCIHHARREGHGSQTDGIMRAGFILGGDSAFVWWLIL